MPKKIKKASPLTTLMTAALALPGLGLSNQASAQSVPDATTVRFLYADYRDYQKDSFEGRMRAKTPTLWAEAPIGEKTVVEGSMTWDSLGGASPYFLNTLTGASGLGVEDIRRAGDIKLTQYFERFSIGLGGAVSAEDDYLSRNGNIEARIWSSDKNTTVAFGGGFSSDDISSSIDATLSEDRKTGSYFVGVTQVINPLSIIQSNITYQSADGYLSDPYKTLDNRPRSREQWAWLTRYRLFFPELEGALHADYRLYFDTFGIGSHTVDLAWYQPLGEHWMIRPDIRYYTQDRAEFFHGSFPPDNRNQHFSADQRMGDFGAITTGLKLIRDLGQGFAADIKFEFIQQKPCFKIGGYNESKAIDPFYATVFTVGLAKKF